MLSNLTCIVLAYWTKINIYEVDFEKKKYATEGLTQMFPTVYWLLLTKDTFYFLSVCRRKQTISNRTQ